MQTPRSDAGVRDDRARGAVFGPTGQATAGSRNGALGPSNDQVGFGIETPDFEDRRFLRLPVVAPGAFARTVL